MSRIGKQPIIIPKGVNVEINENLVVVNGPKGKLEQKVRPELEIKIEDDKVKVLRKKESKLVKSLHGLTRALIANMIQGVTEGFSKTLELHGTGYRVSLEGGSLKIIVGFSHPVNVVPRSGIQFEIEGNNIIKVLGIDKQLVGQAAAEIRNIKKPEPYKGKGIRYQNEFIKIKPGKAAKAGAAEGA